MAREGSTSASSVRGVCGGANQKTPGAACLEGARLGLRLCLMGHAAGCCLQLHGSARLEPFKTHREGGASQRELAFHGLFCTGYRWSRGSAPLLLLPRCYVHIVGLPCPGACC